MVPVNERRHQMLDQLVADEPAELVHALVAPLVEAVANGDGWYARFLARARPPVLRRLTRP